MRIVFLTLFCNTLMICIWCKCLEPASPGPDSDTTMDMEVDSGDMDGGRSLDDPDELSTPDGMFGMDSPFTDREKDEEPIKTIRYDKIRPL